MHNIRNRLIFALLLFSALNLDADEQAKAKRYVLKALPSWEGWCPQEKASGMMDLIFKIKPQICVEIGVYGGSSIFPTAFALKTVGHGIVYAIDPWSNEECIKFTTKEDPNYAWWSQVDLERVYQGFNQMLKKHKLEPFCRVMRTTSYQASISIPNAIDILHIDGNHAMESSFLDAVVYLEKVRPGGYIWFDDIHWHDVFGNPTTQKALSYLLQECAIVQEWDNFALLQKVSKGDSK